MKLIKIDFTMFGSKGEQTFVDCDVKEAVRKLRQQCETVVVHHTTEYDVKVKSIKKYEVKKNFDVVPKHEMNKVKKTD